MLSKSYGARLTVADAMFETKKSQAWVYRYLKVDSGTVSAEDVEQAIAGKTKLVGGKFGEKEWHRGLETFQNGSIKPIPKNLELIFANDEEVSDCFVWDEFSFKSKIVKEIPASTDPTLVVPRDPTDQDNFSLRIWVSGKYQDFSEKQIDEVIEKAARRTPVNSFIGFIDSVPRLNTSDCIDSWLVDYFGAPDTPYVRTVGRYFLLGATARACFPDIKMDNVLFLEGKQGIAKSTACGVLALKPEWFLPSVGDIRSKETYMQMAGKLIVEIAERSGMMKANDNEQKEFFSKAWDVYVPKYSNKPVRQRRTCCFIATTNDNRYLGDPTGGRRYWPVSCGNISADELRLNSDQLWASAYDVLNGIRECENEYCRSAWKNNKIDPELSSNLCSNHRWWPTPQEQEKYFSPEQNKRTFVDETEMDKVASFIKRELTLPGRRRVSTSNIIQNALGVPAGQTQSAQRRVHRIMHSLGFRETTEEFDGAELTYWEKAS